MYTYRRRKFGPSAIFFIVIFTLTALGMGFIAYFNRGMFWDILPFVSIPVIILSLILLILNFIRRTRGNFFFVLFFLLSLTGLILSYIFGPSVLINKAQESYDDEYYAQSIDYYNIILNNYSGSSLAGNALENISYAYYANADYEEAITSFKKAIESKVISESDLEKKEILEIKKILEDSYLKLAQEHHSNNKFNKSAESYINAAEVLKEIKDNFPDTNEAFISVHKIPEYLYNAALNFNKINDLEKSIESLEEIINNYYSSEYFNSAGILLFDVYIDQAIKMADEFNYTGGIEEFLKILDLEVEDKYYSDIPDSEKRKVFYNISADTLKNIAENKFSSGYYKKAAFLYEIIIEYNPDLEEEINPLLVDSKINQIASSDHNVYIPSIPERKLWGREESTLIIENNTGFDLTAYLKGPESVVIRVEKNSTAEIKITAGTYKAASELNTPGVFPYYGIVNYEESQIYREEYTTSD